MSGHRYREPIDPELRGFLWLVGGGAVFILVLVLIAAYGGCA